VNFRDCITFNGSVVKTPIFPIYFLISSLSVYLERRDQTHLLSDKQVLLFQNVYPPPTVALEYVGKAKVSRGISRVGGESNTAIGQRPRWTSGLKTSA